MDYDTPPEHPEQKPADKPEKRYYYAESVRVMFSVSAIIMLVASPFFSHAKILSGIFIIFGIVLIVLAGITNRRLKSIFLINALVCLFIIAVLEFIALSITFADHPFLVILTQFIALILVTSLYYCLRTLRGFLFR